MSGLYFKYGTMNAAKSANLIMIGHNYEEQNMRVIYLKPFADSRDGYINDEKVYISSRIGISKEAYIVYNNTNIEELIKQVQFSDYDVVMVDEAQFLTEDQINQLWNLSEDKVVMCFGLLTDFKRNLFSGSKRLIEVADSIQEIKSICSCGKKAIVNARFINDKIITSGPQIKIGDTKADNNITVYRCLCKDCYRKELKKNELLE